MRKVPITLIVLCSIALGACNQKPYAAPAVPGTPLAARVKAAKYVGLVYSIDDVSVKQEPVIHGGNATVKTVDRMNTACVVELVRSDADKEYGWLIKDVTCDSPRI